MAAEQKTENTESALQGPALTTEQITAQLKTVEQLLMLAAKAAPGQHTQWQNQLNNSIPATGLAALIPQAASKDKISDSNLIPGELEQMLEKVGGFLHPKPKDDEDEDEDEEADEDEKTTPQPTKEDLEAILEEAEKFLKNMDERPQSEGDKHTPNITKDALNDIVKLLAPTVKPEKDTDVKPEDSSIGIVGKVLEVFHGLGKEVSANDALQELQSLFQSTTQQGKKAADEAIKVVMEMLPSEVRSFVQDALNGCKPGGDSGVALTALTQIGNFLNPGKQEELKAELTGKMAAPSPSMRA